MKKLLLTIQQYNKTMDFSKVNNMPIIILISIFLATGWFNLALDYILQEPKKVPNRFNNYWFQFQYFNKNIENHWYSKENIKNVNILLHKRPQGEIVDQYVKTYLTTYNNYILTIERIYQNINKLPKISKFMFDDISSICCPMKASEEEIMDFLVKIPSEQRELLKKLIEHFNIINENAKSLNENLTIIKEQLSLIKQDYTSTLNGLIKIENMDIPDKEKSFKIIPLEAKLLILIAKIQTNKVYGIHSFKNNIEKPLNTIGHTFDNSMGIFNNFHQGYSSYVDEKIEKNKWMKFIFTSLFGALFFMLYVIFSPRKSRDKENIDDIKEKTKHFRY